MIRIVADQNIVAVDEFFQDIGELVKVPGRSISNATLRDADVLLVRSITRVDQALLGGTAVRFIGTATSGTDHVDLDYLTAAGIGFADAKGSNANAVVEYCLTALACLRKYHGMDIDGCSVGVIGAGSVGGLLLQKLGALGFETFAFDPLLAPARRQVLEAMGVRFDGMDAALASNVVSLHVPLTMQGAYPTFHLLAKRELDQLVPNATLINTSRGEVIDSAALLDLLTSRLDVKSVIDVWEGEPLVDKSLVDKVHLATPHIAGYSIEAKLAATRCLAKALREHFGLQDAGKLPPAVSPDGEVISGRAVTSTRDIDDLMLEILPLPEISEGFRNSIDHAMEENVFDLARTQQVGRHEFSHYRIAAHNVARPLNGLLEAIGFGL